MIINKTALKITKVIGKDKAQPVLDNIHITKSGAVVGANGKSIFAVSPTPGDMQEKIPFDGQGQSVVHDITLPAPLLSNVLKTIPDDKMFKGLLELAHINTDGDTVVLTSHDGKGKKVSHGRAFTKRFIDFRGIISNVFLKKKVKATLILDVSRLIDTMTTLKAICGNNPAFVEVTEENDLIIRSFAETTGQEAVAFVTGVQSDWVERSGFVQSLGQRKMLVKKKKAP